MSRDLSWLGEVLELAGSGVGMLTSSSKNTSLSHLEEVLTPIGSGVGMLTSSLGMRLLVGTIAPLGVAEFLYTGLDREVPDLSPSQIKSVAFFSFPWSDTGQRLLYCCSMISRTQI